MKKERIDILLLKRGLTESRHRAQAIIMEGSVEVDGRRVDKPGRFIPIDSEIVIRRDPNPYVSRGGLKLEAALRHFKIDIKGKIMLDIGASTGGFTDCLIRHGASKVMAVDVGKGLIHWRLRNDPKVILFEGKNARSLRKEDLPYAPDGAVIDVSFISLKLIIPALYPIVKDSGFLLPLVKPQFEVGKKGLLKGGVVKDPKVHREILADIIDFCKKEGWKFIDSMESPLLGPKGNREFFIYLIK